ncbi:MAG: DUF6382 domain-containing protein [Clostridia bacterium]
MISEYRQTNKEEYLLASGDTVICPPHMIRMIERNNCPYIMPLKYVSMNELIYDKVSGMSLAEHICRKCYTPELLLALLYSLKELQKICFSYLLDPDHICLDISYVYIYGKTLFRYIFDPFAKGDFLENARSLIKSVIKDNYIHKDVYDACEKDELSLDDVIDSVKGITESGLKEKPDVDYTVMLRNINDADDTIYVRDKDISLGRMKLINSKYLHNRLVSIKHSVLKNVKGELYIKDLNSKNGTYINGERIESNKFLKTSKGDVLSFADDEYIYL